MRRWNSFLLNLALMVVETIVAVAEWREDRRERR